MEIKENLIRKYKKLSDALVTLETAINDIKKTDVIAQLSNEYPEKIYKTFRDSLVQRFEYTFDLTWKYLAEYLENEGRKLEIKTPKAIFRECLKSGILSEEEVRLALKMVDHRNLTTHGYDEELIESIANSIPNYCNLINKIAQSTKP